jgi:hypothetical protein
MVSPAFPPTAPRYEQARSTVARRRSSFRSGRAAHGSTLVTALRAATRLIGKVASTAGVATIALAVILMLAACGPTFQQMAAAECAGSATDTAYADCERRLAQQLADERLGYIVRSQVIH